MMKPMYVYDEDYAALVKERDAARARIAVLETECATISEIAEGAGEGDLHRPLRRRVQRVVDRLNEARAAEQKLRGRCNWQSEKIQTLYKGSKAALSILESAASLDDAKNAEPFLRDAMWEVHREAPDEPT